MRQRWSDLLFLHWPIEPHLIQQLLPDDLIVDTFDGVAYVGVVAFRMTHVGLSWFTPVPGTSAFLECNVRTYVRQNDCTLPGVWFFSLDAANALMATMARATYSLPWSPSTTTRLAAVRRSRRPVPLASAGKALTPTSGCGRAPNSAPLCRPLLSCILQRQ